MTAFGALWLALALVVSTATATAYLDRHDRRVDRERRYRACLVATDAKFCIKEYRP